MRIGSMCENVPSIRLCVMADLQDVFVVVVVCLFFNSSASM